MTTILAAAGLALLVLLAGNLPWSALGRLNGLGAGSFSIGTLVPWAIVPSALYLGIYWRFISGRWGPADGAEWRREMLRANRLSARTWGAALLAGLIGFGALLALLALAARLVRLPTGFPIATPAAMPASTTLILLSMQSIVAGVSEESAFRGYMQTMVERRYGLVVAILSGGVLFGLLHFSNHPRDVLLMLPYYVAVSAVYSGLTWAADSILPSVVLHSVGDIVVLTRWWLTGRPEWLVGAAEPPLIRDTGIDRSFLTVVVAAVVLIALTGLACRTVRRVRLDSRPPA